MLIAKQKVNSEICFLPLLRRLLLVICGFTTLPHRKTIIKCLQINESKRIPLSVDNEYSSQIVGRGAAHSTLKISAPDILKLQMRTLPFFKGIASTGAALARTPTCQPTTELIAPPLCHSIR